MMLICLINDFNGLLRRLKTEVNALLGARDGGSLRGG